MSFDDAGVPGQGEACDDGGSVAVDACGEAVEAGQVVLADRVEPFWEPFALAFRQHDGKGADVPGQWLLSFRA